MNAQKGPLFDQRTNANEVHHPEGRKGIEGTLKAAGFGCYCACGIGRQALARASARKREKG